MDPVVINMPPTFPLRLLGETQIKNLGALSTEI
jgi:hypothetical protein